jgi:dipeptidyl aminopeptidase/acylaminoacyl peptidase
MLRLEEVGETAFSSDGQSLAYVVKRAKVHGAVDGLRQLNNNEHADVWVVSINGETPINITNGLTDGSGYWAPRWSPNGEALSMMGILNGKIQLYLWTKKTNQLKVLTNRNVCPITLENFDEPYLWISDDKIVFVAEQEQTSKLDAMMSAWTRARESRTTTASVLESGVPPNLETRPQRELVTVDVSSGREHTIVTGPGFAELSLSPDRQYLAFYKQVGVWQPDSSISKITVLEPELYQPMLTDFKNAPRLLAGITQAIQGSLLWSPTSTELAIIGYDEPGLKQKFFRCNVSKSACAVVSDNFQDLDPNRLNRYLRPPMSWLATGELLVFSRNEGPSRPAETSKRWWAINETGSARPLFETRETLPTQILPEAEGPNLIAVIGGELWSIATSGKRIKKLLPDSTPKIRSIVWTDRQLQVTNLRTRHTDAAAPVGRLLIAEGQAGPIPSFYLIDTKTSEVKALAEPSLDTRVLAVGNTTRTVALFTDDENGLRILSSQASQSPLTPIVKINEFVREIVHPKWRRFQYYSSDGELLNAWVILPLDYKEGTRYPTIVYGYPSFVYSDRRPRTRVSQTDWSDFSLLAAHGYAVLRVSVPLKSYGETQDVYPELSKGMLPAIDKAIELGIVDPDRIGLFGHSYAGYLVFSLVTQTRRFKVAVASSGLSDLVSLFGTFDAGLRYNSDVHEDLMRMWGVETIGMGGPPWTNMKRYLLNSPVNFVDRVETPLLIIHGDFDYATQIQQSEEFFSGLYRQNKRSRFVRYFGEGHVVQRPANVRDMWNQIFSWFDEFLKPKENTSSAARN